MVVREHVEPLRVQPASQRYVLVTTVAAVNMQLRPDRRPDAHEYTTVTAAVVVDVVVLEHREPLRAYPDEHTNRGVWVNVFTHAEPVLVYPEGHE
ncbi:MAG: hypothetical protein OXD37_06845 [Acidimicrobiaceae bacterium]|nr:hypothetical protein [Acidimicrobiaceae bacterium]